MRLLAMQPLTKHVLGELVELDRDLDAAHASGHV
jgi:hypothetical protein